MNIGFALVSTAVFFGIGLAMDAFSVSLANGLNEPKMKKNKMLTISGVFAFFQALMPMIGWICVRTIVNQFKSFESFIPWIALILLCYIGGKMIYEGIKNKDSTNDVHNTSFKGLVVQGIATSIDALSVGFKIANYNFFEALISAVIIAAVTLIICYIGIIIGKKVGIKLAGKANIFGGIILIFIGLEIFITGVFGG